MDKRVMELQVKLFSALSTDELYEILKLRCDVFVVEQACAYADLDEKDRHPETPHLYYFNTDKALMAYSRVLPPNQSYPEPSIGRVAVAKKYRNQGLARKVVQASVDTIRQYWPNQHIQIGAQEYLLPFYHSFGFKNHSEMYLEDGIPHRDMLL